MKIAVISFFRNSTDYIERYFDQMSALSKLLTARGDRLTLLLGYGDSTDDTDKMLADEAHFSMDALLVDVSHGGREFGSIEHPQRFKQLAYCGNKLLGYVPADADVVGVVESDLIWDAETIDQLIGDLSHVPHPSAVAPMILDGPNSFYDVFAFRKNGQRFTKTLPYWPPKKRWMMCNHLMELDSAGSVLFMDADLARKAKFTDGESIVGFCNDIRNAGGSIWLDPAASVSHPPYDGGAKHQSDTSRARESVRL